MRLDPQLASTVAALAAVGWTMIFAGGKKRMLDPKSRRRRCPSCGKTITGRTCGHHG